MFVFCGSGEVLNCKTTARELHDEYSDKEQRRGTDAGTRCFEMVVLMSHREKCYKLRCKDDRCGRARNAPCFPKLPTNSQLSTSPTPI